MLLRYNYRFEKLCVIVQKSNRNKFFGGGSIVKLMLNVVYVCLIDENVVC